MGDSARFNRLNELKHFQACEHRFDVCHKLPPGKDHLAQVSHQNRGQSKEPVQVKLPFFELFLLALALNEGFKEGALFDKVNVSTYSPSSLKEVAT